MLDESNLPGGRGVLPMMAYTGSLRPCTFFRLQVYKRVGISLADVYQRVGKYGSVKGPNKANG